MEAKISGIIATLFGLNKDQVNVILTQLPDNSTNFTYTLSGVDHSDPFFLNKSQFLYTPNNPHILEIARLIHENPIVTLVSPPGYI
jgi:hypothetical protein